MLNNTFVSLEPSRMCLARFFVNCILQILFKSYLHSLFLCEIAPLMFLARCICVPTLNRTVNVIFLSKAHHMKSIQEIFSKEHVLFLRCKCVWKVISWKVPARILVPRVCNRYSAARRTFVLLLCLLKPAR